MSLAERIRGGLLWPVRALLPKNRWWRLVVLALPFVLLLLFVGPVLDVLVRIAELLVRLVEPLLQTTLGRLLLLVLVLGVLALLSVLLLRARVRELRSHMALGRHLQAVQSLLGDDRRRCRELFLKVARYRGPLPAEYPALLQDANLKLARLCLEAGEIDAALRWTTRVVEPDLPAELQRSLLQLRVRALRLQGEVLPATLEQELRAAVDRFGDDYTLQRELRALLAQRGDPLEVAQQQAKVVKLAPPVAQASERRQWIVDLEAAAKAALAAGDLDSARKLVKPLRHADRDGPGAGLLLGAIAAAEGDLRRAAREWGATRSPEGLDRIAELLSAHPGALEPRELLECCPLQGTLLLVARELARQGDKERAERAARTAASALGPTPTVCAVLVEVLQLLGKEAEARLLCEQTVARLLQGDVPVRAPQPPPHN